MRLGSSLVLATAVLSTGAEAATVLHGMLDPVNGLAVLSNDGQPNPSNAIPDGKKISVTFAINQGVIAEVRSSLDYRYTYVVISSDPNAIPFGNDVDGSELCTFNGSGPDGCFGDSAFVDPSVGPAASRFITNLVVGQRSLSYDVFKPAGFDRCDHPVLDTECSVRWTVFNDFQFTVASHKPVGYTLTFGVPEPASWAMMIAGFGAVGAAHRRSRRRTGAHAPSIAPTVRRRNPPDDPILIKID